VKSPRLPMERSQGVSESFLAVQLHEHEDLRGFAHQCRRTDSLFYSPSYGGLNDHSGPRFPKTDSSKLLLEEPDRVLKVRPLQRRFLTTDVFKQRHFNSVSL
jgi:hypothetical protein